MTARHDPGGKVRLRMDDHVYGDALFSGPNDCYRLILTRKWVNFFSADTRLPKNFILWICLNPSTADASFNDPTLGRLMDFSMQWDFDGLALMNLCDFRATKPEGLFAPEVVPRSAGNLPLIRNTAKEAKKIVVGWGTNGLNPGLLPLAIETESALRADGHTLYCLGKTKHGAPKHPLYVLGDTPLEEFKEIPV